MTTIEVEGALFEYDPEDNSWSGKDEAIENVLNAEFVFGKCELEAPASQRTLAEHAARFFGGTVIKAVDDPPADLEV